MLVDLGKTRPNAVYRLKLTVTDSIGSTSSTVVSLTTNGPPTSGTFAVSPYRGTALTTEFEFLLDGWSDDVDDYPLTYTYSYRQRSSRRGQQPRGAGRPHKLPQAKNANIADRRAARVRPTEDLTPARRGPVRELVVRHDAAAGRRRSSTTFATLAAGRPAARAEHGVDLREPRGPRGLPDGLDLLDNVVGGSAETGIDPDAAASTAAAVPCRLDASLFAAPAGARASACGAQGGPGRPDGRHRRAAKATGTRTPSAARASLSTPKARRSRRRLRRATSPTWT